MQKYCFTDFSLLKICVLNLMLDDTLICVQPCNLSIQEPVLPAGSCCA